MKLYEVEVGKNTYITCDYETARESLYKGMIVMDNGEKVTNIPEDNTITKVDISPDPVITARRK